MNKLNSVFVYSIVLIIMIVFFSCQNQNNYSYENLIKEGDSIVKTIDKNKIKIYAEISNNKYEQITDIDNWDKDYLSIINLYEGKNAKVYKVIFESESGDYSYTNDSYYDKNNNLKVLISYCSYFNSICEKGILTKKTIYYYTNKNVISKSTMFFNDKNIQIKDPTDCIDNYSCSVNPIFNYTNIPPQSVLK